MRFTWTVGVNKGEKWIKKYETSYKFTFSQLSLTFVNKPCFKRLLGFTPIDYFHKIRFYLKKEQHGVNYICINDHQSVDRDIESSITLCS